MSQRAFAALWVGGPPGATLKRQLAKLSRDEIDVREVQERFHHVPAWAELVLVNIDMISHGDFAKARDAADGRAVPCVAVHTDYCRTRAALELTAILRATTTTTTTTNHEEETMATDNDTITSHDLDAFLTRVPKELLPQAKTHVARRMREDDVTTAAVALSLLDTDGVTDFLAVLDDDIKKTLREALGVAAP